MDLILFYGTGQTFQFSQVSNLMVDGDKVDFDYYGVSTQMCRHATFTGIVGYAVDKK